MRRAIIPGIVQEQDVCTMKASETAVQAAKKMAAGNVSAIIVVDDGGEPAGIVTEGDLTRRVLAKELDAAKVRLKDIMTANPDTLSPKDAAGDALELMHIRRYRHLPVVEGGRVLAVVSIGDLLTAVETDLEKNIRRTEAFVFGGRTTLKGGDS